MTENEKDLQSSQELADKLQPLIVALDVILLNCDIEDMKRKCKGMRENNRWLEAWPFPETMRKAEIRKSQIETFEAIINLFEVRTKQIEIQRKPDETPGQQVLKQLGF